MLRTWHHHTEFNFPVVTLTCTQFHRVVWHPQRLLPFSSGALPSPTRVRQHLLQPAAWWLWHLRGDTCRFWTTESCPHVLPQRSRDHAIPWKILGTSPQNVYRHTWLKVTAVSQELHSCSRRKPRTSTFFVFFLSPIFFTVIIQVYLVCQR